MAGPDEHRSHSHDRDEQAPTLQLLGRSVVGSAVLGFSYVLSQGPRSRTASARVVLLGRGAAGEAVMGAMPSMSRQSKSRSPAGSDTGRCPPVATAPSCRRRDRRAEPVGRHWSVRPADAAGPDHARPEDARTGGLPLPPPLLRDHYGGSGDGGGAAPDTSTQGPWRRRA